MKKLLLLGLIFLFTFCATETQEGQKDVVELLPTDGEISGWTRSGGMQVANNETELFGLIDGEGQVYVDNGFVKCAFQTYTGDIAGTSIDLALRIFDMGNTTNAKNVYDDVGTGQETPWTDNHAGVEARIDETLLFDYKIDFWDDRFYVWITIYENKTQAALDVAKLFALNVSEAIRE